VLSLLQWKGNEYYILCVCICSLGYPACNAHVLYFYLWTATLHSTFSTLSYKRHDFQKKYIYIYWTQNVCFDFLYSLCFSEAFLILRRNERQMIKIYIGLQVKYPLLLSDFNEISILSTDFRKIYKYQI